MASKVSDCLGPPNWPSEFHMSAPQYASNKSPPANKYLLEKTTVSLRAQLPPIVPLFRLFLALKGPWLAEEVRPICQGHLIKTPAHFCWYFERQWSAAPLWLEYETKLTNTMCACLTCKPIPLSLCSSKEELSTSKAFFMTSQESCFQRYGSLFDFSIEIVFILKRLYGIALLEFISHVSVKNHKFWLSISRCPEYMKMTWVFNLLVKY